MPESRQPIREAPFDTGRLDELMAAAGLDAILVTSRHNVRYLLGGYRFFFFAHMDAVGSSRYLPVVLYVRNRPGDTTYFANVARVDGIQQVARNAVRPGVTGREIYRAAEAAIAAAGGGVPIGFVIHGMGLVSHEAPQLTSSGDVLYDADYEDRGILPGMVLSIETTIRHPKRGFIKLEDAVYVTEHGHHAIGDAGRGWNRIPGAM